MLQALTWQLRDVVVSVLQMKEAEKQAAKFVIVVISPITAAGTSRNSTRILDRLKTLERVKADHKASQAGFHIHNP